MTIEKSDETLTRYLDEKKYEPPQENNEDGSTWQNIKSVRSEGFVSRNHVASQKIINVLNLSAVLNYF